MFAVGDPFRAKTSKRVEFPRVPFHNDHNVEHHSRVNERRNGFRLRAEGGKEEAFEQRPRVRREN